MMLKNKKKSQITLSVLTIMVICYISFQYYNNYKKKESYRDSIASELKTGLWFIEEVHSDNITTTQKEIDKLFNSFLDKNTNLNTELIRDLVIDINHKFIGIQLASQYLEDINWKSAEQSGILSQFSIYTLKNLNSAYNKRKELIALEKKLQKMGFEHPFFYKNEISQGQLYQIKSEYNMLFVKYKSVVASTSFAYHNALKQLKPEHKYLKRSDSLVSKKRNTHTN